MVWDGSRSLEVSVKGGPRPSGLTRHDPAAPWMLINSRSGAVAISLCEE